MSECVLQALEAGSAVRKSGQRIVEEVVLQLLFGAFALGDIAVDDDEFCDVTVGIADSAGIGFDDPPASVLVLDAVFEALADTALAGDTGGLEHAQAVVGMDLLE